MSMQEMAKQESREELAGEGTFWANNFFRFWLTSIDRWSFLALSALMAMGVLISFSISPDVARKLELGNYVLALKHSVFALASWVLLVCLSLLSARDIRRVNVFVFILALLALFLVPFMGQSYNGALRWLDLGPFSFQPSELIKPSFAIVVAWLISAQCRGDPVPGMGFTLLLYLLIICFLLGQPDIGQSLILTAIILSQWFVAGMPIILISLAFAVVFSGLVFIYFSFPHFADRIQGFINPADFGLRQVDIARKALENGGFMGEGAGGGLIKQRIFDLQSDFVLVAIGEDFGIVACLLVIFCYVLVIIRGFWRSFMQQDLFVILTVTGLLVQFACQILINIGSVSGLIPPKGTTLPFLSSGGTAMLSMAYGMAFVLALTRKKNEGEARS